MNGWESFFSGGSLTSLDVDTLTRRAEVRRLLAGVGVRPSKRLGQNFLVDRAAVQAIRAEAAALEPARVVEIGPGLGAVTSLLADLGVPLVGVEVDRRLAERLREETARSPSVEIIQADALTYDFGHAEGEPCVVVGSIPYSITAPLLKHLVNQRRWISAAVLVTQREVAEKVQASPGSDGSALGVLIRAYASTRIVRRIPRGAFLPVPDVDSTLWTIRFHDRPSFEAPEAHFFAVVRAAYGKRRKMLRASLKSLADGEAVLTALDRAGIDATRRGEVLSLYELDRLALALAEVGVFSGAELSEETQWR